MSFFYSREMGVANLYLRKFWVISAAIFSSILLTIPYVNQRLFFLSYLAFIPFYLSLFARRRVVFFSFIFSFCHFFISFFWLRHIEHLGIFTPVLVAFLTCFFLIFWLVLFKSFQFYYLKHRNVNFNWWSYEFYFLTPLDKIILSCVAASSFTFFEYARYHILSGFPWNTLTQSQVDTNLIYLISYLGPLSISFVVVFINFFLAFSLEQF